MTTATAFKGQKRLFPLQRDGICVGCGKPQPKGTIANAVGNTVYCEADTLKWASERGYEVVYSNQNSAPRTVTPGQGNGEYISRVAFEQFVNKLNEHMTLRMTEINQRLLKLEAENAELKRALKGEQTTDKSVEGGYKCEDCDAVFETGQALGGHRKSHSGEKGEKPLPQPNF